MSVAQDMNENTKSVQQGTNLLKRMGFKMSPKLIAMMKDMDLIKSKEVARVNATNATVEDDVNKAVDKLRTMQPAPNFNSIDMGGELPSQDNIKAEALGTMAQDVIRRMDGGLMNLSPQARMNQGLMQFYPPVQRMANGGNLTLGQRNNNFGNIRTNPSNNWLGKISDPENLSGYEQFANPLFGLRALDILLGNYGSKNNIKTTRGLVERFAPTEDNPEEEGFIPTTKYAEAIANNLGVDIDDEIDLTDPEVRNKVIPTITNIESRQDVSVDDINKARTLTEEDESALINSALVGRPSESQEGMSPEENNAINLINQVGASVLPSPGSRDPSGMFGAMMATGSPTQTKRLELEQAEVILENKKRRAEKIKEGKTVPIARPFLGSPTAKEIKEAEDAVNKKREELEDEQRKALEAKYKEDRGYYDTLDPRGFPDLVTPGEKMTKEEQKAIDEEARLSALEKYPKDYFKTPKKKGEDPQKVRLVRDPNSPSGYSAKTIVDGEIVLTPTDSDGTRYVHRNKDNKIIRNKDNSIKYFDDPPEGVKEVIIDGKPVIDIEKIKEGIADEILETEGKDPEQQQKSIDGILAKLKKLPADEVIAFIAGMIDSPTVTAGVKAGLTNALNTRLANKKLDATIRGQDLSYSAAVVKALESQGIDQETYLDVVKDIANEYNEQLITKSPAEFIESVQKIDQSAGQVLNNLYEKNKTLPTTEEVFAIIAMNRINASRQIGGLGKSSLIKNIRVK